MEMLTMLQNVETLNHVKKVWKCSTILQRVKMLNHVTKCENAQPCSKVAKYKAAKDE
jgi:hypothetical protein